MSQSLINQGNILTGCQKYSHCCLKKASQSLINQGNILTIFNIILINCRKFVAIPYKSGKYSY